MITPKLTSFRNPIFSKRSGWICQTTSSFSSDTGAFRKRFPHLNSPEIHFKKAEIAMKKIKVDNTIKNVRNARRKHAAQSLDALMKALTVPISRSIDAYRKTIFDLHPFESTVANLTMVSRIKSGKPSLNSILAKLKFVRSTTCQIAKLYAVRAKSAPNSLEVSKILEDGVAELRSLYESEDAQGLTEILSIQKELRRIPVIELNTPTVVLVGAPNVGKSSIVRTVSTGMPEVNNYPFTTRGVTVGHIIERDESGESSRIQIMDTPGLLDRSYEDRNEMEKLTFASLAHLPSAVIFVIDPTGLAGAQSNLQAQLNIRHYLRSRFPRRPWLDVVTKCEIKSIENAYSYDNIAHLLPQPHLEVSMKEGINVDTLGMKILELVKELKVHLQAMEFQLIRDEKDCQEIEDINNSDHIDFPEDDTFVEEDREDENIDEEGRMSDIERVE